MFLYNRSPRMMPKVYRFKYPDRRVSYLVLFILCLSVLAIVLPTCYSESLFLSSIFPIVSAGVFLIIIILLASLAIRQRNRLRQQPKGRLRRLSLLLSHPQALKRWPHRVVEHLYRSKGEPSQSKLRRLLNTIPNGANLLANECEPFDVGSPSCSEVAFEPVGLDEPVHKYTSIICLGYEVSDEDMEMYQKPSPDATTGPTDFRVWLYRVQGVVLVALAVLAIALCLGLLGYFTGIYGKWFFVAGVIVYFVTLHPLWIPLIWSKHGGSFLAAWSAVTIFYGNHKGRSRLSAHRRPYPFTICAERSCKSLTTVGL